MTSTSLAAPAKTRYDLMAQALHWATAIAIVAAYALIMVAEEMPRGAEKSFVMGLHKSLGVTVVALVLARLVWRRISPPPALPEGAAWMTLAAKAGHAALYALMLLVPVAGVVMSWAGGRPVEVFGLFTLPTLLPADPLLKGMVEDLHEVVGNLIMLVAGLHAGAAIFHQYVLKDGVLTRMLPWGARGAGA